MAGARGARGRAGKPRQRPQHRRLARRRLSGASDRTGLVSRAAGTLGRSEAQTVRWNRCVCRTDRGDARCDEQAQGIAHLVRGDELSGDTGQRYIWICHAALKGIRFDKARVVLERYWRRLILLRRRYFFGCWACINSPPARKHWCPARSRRLPRRPSASPSLTVPRMRDCRKQIARLVLNVAPTHRWSRASRGGAKRAIGMSSLTRGSRMAFLPVSITASASAAVRAHCSRSSPSLLRLWDRDWRPQNSLPTAWLLSCMPAPSWLLPREFISLPATIRTSSQLFSAWHSADLPGCWGHHLARSPRALSRRRTSPHCSCLSITSHKALAESRSSTSLSMRRSTLPMRALAYGVSPYSGWGYRCGLLLSRKSALPCSAVRSLMGSMVTAHVAQLSERHSTHSKSGFLCWEPITTRSAVWGHGCGRFP